MIQSMTGYARSEFQIDNFNFIIDIRSLNSKNIDLNIRIPNSYREKEMDIRKLLSGKLIRGKIDLTIYRESLSVSSNDHHLNTDLIKDYHNQIISLQKELGLKKNNWTFTPINPDSTDILSDLLKMPDVVKKNKFEVNKNHWAQITECIDKTILDLIKFRLDEGKNLEKDIVERAHKLTSILKLIQPYAKSRIEQIKSSLKENLLKEDLKINENRFEQELIYYIEKQDITEEQVRLSSHLEYFIKTMNQDSPNGKKLGFICQEIFREVNTIGSKSGHAEMQKLVVEMKDEAEKIKEQLLNIL